MYRFFLTFQGVKREITPSNSGSIRIKIEQEDDQIFYRKKLSTPVILSGSDYQFLYKIEVSENRCERIELSITRIVDGADTDIFTGLFSCSDGDWDIDKCSVSLNIKESDRYTQILENWETEHNMMLVSSFADITFKDFLVIDPGNYQFGAFPDESYNNSPGWVLLHRDPGEEMVPGYKLAFREIATTELYGSGSSQPKGDGWIMTQDIQNTRTIWVREPTIDMPITVSELYSEFEIRPSGATSPGSGYFLLEINYFDPNPLLTLAKARPSVWWKPRQNSATFVRGRRLVDVLSFLLEKINIDYVPQDITDVSNFFEGPVDFVFGGTNRLKDALLYQNSDAKRPLSSEPAVKQEISLKTILDWIRNQMNAFWFITDTGKFRIEHYNFFRGQNSLDLTSVQYSKYLSGTNSYSYDKASIPRKEIWKANENATLDFIGEPIQYSTYCGDTQSSDNDRTYSVSEINTDIAQMVRSPGQFSDEGVTMVIHDGEYIRNEYCFLSKREQVNGGMSIANCMVYFHRIGRPYDRGIMNRKEEAFTLVKNSKKQKDITIPYCGKFIDFSGIFTTQISQNGTIQSAEINLRTDSVTLTLLHPIFTDGVLDLIGHFSESFDDSFL